MDISILLLGKLLVSFDAGPTTDATYYRCLFLHVLLMCCLSCPRRGLAGDVHVRGPEEVLQCHEETGVEAATETDTKTKGLVN